MAKNEKEELLLELFPSVAERFLKGRRVAEWEETHERVNEGSEAAAAAEAAALAAMPVPDPASIQYFTPPAFASDSARLDDGYEVADGHPDGYWGFAVDTAE